MRTNCPMIWMPRPVKPSALAHWLAIQAVLAVRGVELKGSRELIELVEHMSIPYAVEMLAVIVKIEDAIRGRS